VFACVCVLFVVRLFITGPPNGPVLFCSLASVVCQRSLSSSVTLPAAGGHAAGRVAGRVADTARRASMVTSRKGDTLLYWTYKIIDFSSPQSPIVALAELLLF